MKKRYREEQIMGFLRVYAPRKPQIKRRKRKKAPITDRQPLERPKSANAVWSMDFIFERISSGRPLKIPGIVDDATTECVVVHDEHALGRKGWAG